MYEQSGNDTTAWTLIFYDDESRPTQLSYFMSYAVGSGSAVLDIDHINTYDDDGNVELYKVKSGNVSYVFDPTYDSLNRIDSRTASLVTSSGTLTNTVDYEFTANGTNTSLQISKYISTIGSTSTTYQYVYDANGNITQIKDADNNIKCRYTYDDLGQLIREDNSALNKSFTYTYDLAGNITSRKTYAFTTGTLGTATKTETLGYNDSSWGDRLTSWQGTTITYDEIGNPTWYSIDYLTCLLSWNGRQLASFENMDGLRTYTYNDEGIRIAKNDRGTLHTYQVDGTQIISETWGIHTIFYVYDENGSIAGMRYRTSNYAEGVFDEFLFEKNLQGDVVAIYNASGVKLVSYTYDAWGKVTTTYHNNGASTPARFNPFKYRGYYHDDDTNLYYLNSRYYDPATGRFINADEPSLLGANGDINSYNLYAYCSNNPIMGYDPMGTWDWGVFTDVAITVVAGWSSIISGITTTLYLTHKVGFKKAKEIGTIQSLATFSAINNAANAIYYEFSVGESDLTPTSYNDKYISRWDRLDYTKQQTQEVHYNLNAWRYYSEYSLHMYGWYATGWANEKNIPIISMIASKSKSAEVDPSKGDHRTIIKIVTVIFGVLGV